MNGDASAASVTATGSNTARSLQDRAADEINVKDYSTFQAAVAQANTTNKVLRLPPGAYSYTSGSLLTVSVPVIFEPGRY
jgi:hypothetical protein